MPRQDRCGRYQRTPEIIASQRESAQAYWSDPEARRRHSELVKARMARPGVSERISARTRAALISKAIGVHS
jgi:hypothetical protein